MEEEREILLFVGGLVDGSRMAVYKKTPTYIFPFSPEPLVLRCGGDPDKSATIMNTPYVYVKIPFFAGRKTVNVMAHASLKSTDVLEMLIENYVGNGMRIKK